MSLLTRVDLVERELRRGFLESIEALEPRSGFSLNLLKVGVNGAGPGPISESVGNVKNAGKLLLGGGGCHVE